MAVPDYQSLMLPLLNIAGDRNEHSLNEAVERLAQQIGLSEIDRNELLPIRQNIIHTALRVSLVYASPMWWDTLSPELQAHTSELQLSNIISLQNL